MSRNSPGHQPPLGIDLFLFFFADSGPKKACHSGMNAGTPKTGAWRGVVVVRHFVALRDESDAPVECRARKIADSGAD
ncbi:hypothetical protein DSH02_23735 [Salmonella enterica subsp. enterica serovar Tchad]|nr:hypothetical protein [Salmonella enterica subsp. enterica serovar Tchad]ECA0360806.1 hypothetical protein [Salmonella enterica subsp. enterica serovar Tchad]ECG3415382.1 hypothetical protein [Salmonella enterica subsp. enterica serovar Tchad]ECO5915032.1 hypothetical protein [Salmonella enterica]